MLLWCIVHSEKVETKLTSCSLFTGIGFVFNYYLYFPSHHASE
jgi:hypothetical protein